MKEYVIYTAGKMNGLEYTEQMQWRLAVEKAIGHAIADRSFNVCAKYIHPPLYYEYGAKFQNSEKEVKEWDTTRVMQSDIVIVNTDHVADSTGTHYELALCDAVNRLTDKHIFVIGVGSTSPEDLHPWIADSIMRYEETIEEAAQYIVDYLLI